MILTGQDNGSRRSGVYPRRWMYIRDAGENTGTLIRRAAACGLNGVALSFREDLHLQSAEYLDWLRQVRKVCDDCGVDLVPVLFSPGYGSWELEQNPNLAEGIPVKDALFIAHNGCAHLLPDHAVAINNGGFEEFADNLAAGYGWQDHPGEVSFIDTEVYKEGRAALRLENLQSHPHKYGRLHQEIEVKPYRFYRITCWVKTEKVEPVERRFRILVKTADERWLSACDPFLPATGEWRKLSVGFNSLNYDRVTIHLGDWGAVSGRYWIDDLHIEETALLNILRREGTPLTVRDEETGRIFHEGKDYLPVSDPGLDFGFDRQPPVMALAAGSDIRDGQRLRVSYYHGMASNTRVEGSYYVKQVSLCMSTPELYRMWRESFDAIHEVLGADKYLLSMDEIRSGGTCEACKNSGRTMAGILSDCIRRQAEIIRSRNPEAEIMIWSDMLDPNHNARNGRYACLVEGDFTGVWESIPRDMIIMCWNYDIRDLSLKHFAGHGFRTMAAAYYDGDDLENVRGWLEALDKTPGAGGIMYTTWQNKYGLLEGFGEMVSGKQQQAG